MDEWPPPRLLTLVLEGMNDMAKAATFPIFSAAHDPDDVSQPSRAEENRPAPSTRRALLLVLLATLGLSLKGIWARLAYSEGASVEQVLFYRASLSLPLILLCGRWFSNRTPDGTSPPWGRKQILIGLAMGAFFSIGMFCDFQSIYYLGAGVSRVVLFGYPLVVMVLETKTTRRLPSGQRLVGFAVAWVGLLLVCAVFQRLLFPSGHAKVAFSWAQLSWGFASLILYGSYVFLSGRFSQTMGPSRLSLLSNVSTSLVVMAGLLIKSGGRWPAGPGLGWVAAMVVVSTVVPYFLMMEGISKLGATRASLTAMVGPAMTLFASALILDEMFSFGQLVGVLLTLVGVVIVQAPPRAKVRLHKGTAQ